MGTQTQTTDKGLAPDRDESFDFVDATARIAVYDDLLSSPRIIDIAPDATREFIGALAAAVYDSSKGAGGTIPYSIILQVAENFIHSRFREVVVSVLDGGNTIRFSDQGPGIADKEKAQQPGYSSATAPMKRYINGVGSGLPIVREYMETQHGTIRIEDNIGTGAVVTISMANASAPGADLSRAENDSQSQVSSQASDFPSRASDQKTQQSPASDASRDPLEVAASMLSQRAMAIVRVFAYEDIWGVKDLAQETGMPISSAYSELKKLEEAGMMARLGKKYKLSELGERVAQNLS